jgi:ABC-type ATPase involved in cell division
MELIRLVHYFLKSPDGGTILQDVNFSLKRGDRVSIVAHDRHEVQLFMRGLASLVYPTNGKMFFQGKNLDFSDYRNLLAYKQKVGYIASEMSLISNKSVRDNLMLMIHYFENSFSMPIPDDIIKLCNIFHLDPQLDLRPTYLDPEKRRIAIIIREISKRPDILLIERPGEFLGVKSFDMLKSILRGLIDTGIALVCYALNEDFVNQFSTREIVIEKGSVVENTVD